MTVRLGVRSDGAAVAAMLARAAMVSAVMIWVKPGPQVVDATPTLPVARA